MTRQQDDDHTPAPYEVHMDRLQSEGFVRGARDERTTFRHPDGRIAKLSLGAVGFTVKRARKGAKD